MPSYMLSNDTNTQDSMIQTWLPATILVGGDCSMNPWSNPIAPSIILPNTNALHINGHHYHNQYTQPIYSNIHTISPIKHTRIEAWEEE